MTTTEPVGTDTSDTSNAAEPTPAAPHAPRGRKRLRRVGLILWMLVFAGLFVIWKQHQTRLTKTIPTLPQPAVIHETADDKSPTSGTSTGNPAGPNGSSPDAPVAVSKSNSSRRGRIWDADGIADFSLTERSGRTVTRFDLLGHPWAVCFIFTRCAGPCPRISAQMYKLQTALKNKNARLVTITVDPKYDSPKILRRYAEMFGADVDSWLYLTGDQREIYRLIHHSFKLPVKEIIGEDRQPGFQVIHTTYILHVDAFGRVQGKYNAQLTPDMVALRRALDRDRSAAAYHLWQNPVSAPKPLSAGSRPKDL